MFVSRYFDKLSTSGIVSCFRPLENPAGYRNLAGPSAVVSG